MGNFSKPVTIIMLPKLPTVVAIFVKVSKSFTFLVIGQLLLKFGDFLLVTLDIIQSRDREHSRFEQFPVQSPTCSQCYKTFFGGNLENVDFPLS